VGIKATNGVVLATEKKHKSILYEDQSVYKVEMITKHTGMVYSGEFDTLSNFARTLPVLR
jgi:20S proteasome subunit alpha 2